MLTWKFYRVTAMLLLLAGVAVSTSACNTIGGLGEDVSAVGKATTGASDTVGEQITEPAKTTP